MQLQQKEEELQDKPPKMADKELDGPLAKFRDHTRQQLAQQLVNAQEELRQHEDMGKRISQLTELRMKHDVVDSARSIDDTHSSSSDSASNPASSELEEKLAHAQQRAENAEIRADEAEQEYKRLDKRGNHLEMQNAKILDECDNMHKRAEAAEQEKERLQHELNLKQHEPEASQSQTQPQQPRDVDGAKACELQDMLEEERKLSAKYRNEIANLQSQLTELKDRADHAESEQHRLQGFATEMQEEREYAEAHVETLTAKLEEACSSRDRIEGEKQLLSNKLDSEQERVAQEESEKAEALATIEAQEQTIQSLRASQVETDDHSCQSPNDCARALQGDSSSDRLQIELENEQAARSTAEMREEQAQAQLSQLRCYLNEQHEEKEHASALMEKLNEAEEIRNAMNDELEAMRSEKKQQDKELSYERTEKIKTQKEAAELRKWYEEQVQRDDEVTHDPEEKLKAQRGAYELHELQLEGNEELTDERVENVKTQGDPDKPAGENLNRSSDETQHRNHELVHECEEKAEAKLATDHLRRSYEEQVQRLQKELQNEYTIRLCTEAELADAQSRQSQTNQAAPASQSFHEHPCECCRNLADAREETNELQEQLHSLRSSLVTIESQMNEQKRKCDEDLKTAKEHYEQVNDDRAKAERRASEAQQKQKRAEAVLAQERTTRKRAQADSERQRRMVRDLKRRLHGSGSDAEQDPTGESACGQRSLQEQRRESDRTNLMSQSTSAELRRKIGQLNQELKESKQNLHDESQRAAQLSQQLETQKDATERAAQLWAQEKAATMRIDATLSVDSASASGTKDGEQLPYIVLDASAIYSEVRRLWCEQFAERMSYFVQCAMDEGYGVDIAGKAASWKTEFCKQQESVRGPRENIDTSIMDAHQSSTEFHQQPDAARELPLSSMQSSRHHQHYDTKSGSPDAHRPGEEHASRQSEFASNCNSYPSGNTNSVDTGTQTTTTIGVQCSPPELRSIRTQAGPTLADSKKLNQSIHALRERVDSVDHRLQQEMAASSASSASSSEGAEVAAAHLLSGVSSAKKHLKGRSDALRAVSTQLQQVQAQVASC